jgi:formiminotetrahydrofolate cyclodeaminase
LPEAGSLWKTTLEEFRDRVAGTGPTPAGVAVAAVSAALGFSLVEKALRIAGARKDFAGDRAELLALADRVHQSSEWMSMWADSDVEVFDDYLAAKRRKDPPAVFRCLRRAVGLPLEIARGAASGLDLCAEAAGFVPAAVAPDLATAVILLNGAARATLLSVESNLTLLPAGTQFQRDTVAEIRKIEKLLERSSPNAP